MSESVAQLVGARIRYYRDLRGLTQAELASLSKTSVATINRMENGKQNFSFDWLGTIAQALDVTVWDFFDGLRSVDDPSLAIVIRLLRGLSEAERGDILFVLGKLLEGKSDAQTVALLRRASGLSRDPEMVS